MPDITQNITQDITQNTGEHANCLCRECSHLCTRPETKKAARCPKCNSPRLKYHPELSRLSMAHIDCDSFYAAIEKRDDPTLADKPVIVGGGQRGVVAAACYVARLYGIRSAMPLFKAKQLCPNLIAIRPALEKYRTVGRQIRKMMQEITPMVEPLSIDEAFLDLSGTEKLHKACPAQTLAAFAKRVEKEIGISVSIGLSHNKFLAKIASDMEKPKGFAIIGRKETMDFLADKPVTIIWGVGKALAKTLHQDGIEKIEQLRDYEKLDLMRRYGQMGKRLYHLCRGEDRRKISYESETKSISSETTFTTDISDYARLENSLWKLCDKVSQRMKKQNLAARTVVLKLKTKDFKQITRNRTLMDPTMLADQLFRIGKQLLQKEANGRAFRLLGIGAAELVEGDLADPLDLADPDGQKRAKIENTMDLLRDKLGDDAIMKGRSLT